VRFELHDICFFIFYVFNYKCDTTSKSSKPNDKYHFRSFFQFVDLLQILSLGTVFGSFIAIFSIFTDLHNGSFTSPVFIDFYTYSHVCHPPIFSSSISFESYIYVIRLIWYRMSVVISSQDLETKSPLIWSFEIKNGLLGVKRDRFVSLIGYVHFDENNNKTRNVLIKYFFFFFFFFFYFFLLL
jgi:hypothetical protein